MKRSEFIAGCLLLSAREGLTFIPLLGLIPAFANFRLFLKLSRAADERWNPAQRELVMGFAVSVLGGFFNLVVIGLFLIYLARL